MHLYSISFSNLHLRCNSLKFAFISESDAYKIYYSIFILVGLTGYDRVLNVAIVSKCYIIAFLKVDINCPIWFIFTYFKLYSYKNKNFDQPDIYVFSKLKSTYDIKTSKKGEKILRKE